MEQLIYNLFQFWNKTELGQTRYFDLTERHVNWIELEKNLSLNLR